MGEPIPRLLAGSPRSAIVVGAVAGVALVAFGFLYDVALRAILGHSPPYLWNVVRDFAPLVQIAVLAIGALAVPFCEEIFFRGAMFGSFTGAGYVRVGAVVSAIVFAVMHFDLINIALLLVVGLILAWVYHRTGSILTPIVAHGVNNAAAFGLIILT